MLAVAHYMQPPPFAPAGSANASAATSSCPTRPTARRRSRSRRGWRTNNRHGPWSITVHEAYPGHHWHFAWLAAQSDNRRCAAAALRVRLDRTSSRAGGSTPRTCCASRASSRTPEQELCQRDFRLFRAARIIVDTSLHLGEMTIEEAVDFMSTKASLSRDTAQAEVLRYCAWPTQASSYLTGALEIDRMRQRWFDEARGSLRDFHDRAAGSGRLPISLVERALFG